MAGREKNPKPFSFLGKIPCVQEAGPWLLPRAGAGCPGSAGKAGARSSEAGALQGLADAACSGSKLKSVSWLHFTCLMLLVAWSVARGFPCIALPVLLRNATAS